MMQTKSQKEMNGLLMPLNTYIFLLAVICSLIYHVPALVRMWLEMYYPFKPILNGWHFNQLVVLNFVWHSLLCTALCMLEDILWFWYENTCLKILKTFIECSYGGLEIDPFNNFGTSLANIMNLKIISQMSRNCKVTDYSLPKAQRQRIISIYSSPGEERQKTSESN